MTHIQQNSIGFLQQQDSVEQNSLPNWLQVNWFFPLGFRKQEIVATSEYFLCYGQNEIYKFSKNRLTGSDRRLSFDKLWSRAVVEVLDNNQVAPDLYLGLRPLCWVDGSPVWLDFIPVSRLSARSQPPLAHEVAIVMRKVDESATLRGILSNENSSDFNYANLIVQSLEEFHNQTKKVVISKLAVDPFFVLNIYEKKYIQDLISFRNNVGAYLDPYSEIELSESMAFLRKYIVDQEETILRRSHDGWITDTHGDLRSVNAVYLADNEGKSFKLFNRPNNGDYRRVDDILSDLASLVVDLRIHNFDSVANQLETNYSRRLSSGFDRSVYKFHLVAQSLRQAMLYFRNEGIDVDALQKMNDCLTSAFRYASGIENQFLVVLVERGQDKYSAQVAEALNELVPSKVVDISQCSCLFHDCEIPRPIVLDKMLEAITQTLEEKISPIVVWDFLREEEIYDLKTFVSKRNLCTLFVQVDYPNKQPERLRINDDSRYYSTQAVESIYPHWIETRNDLSFSYLRIEPLMTTIDTALYIFREIKWLASNIDHLNSI